MCHDTIEYSTAIDSNELDLPVRMQISKHNVECVWGGGEKQNKKLYMCDNNYLIRKYKTILYFVYRYISREKYQTIGWKDTDKISSLEREGS